MSKKIFIDASSKDETRIALTLDGRLDDFEIETTKKVAVKSDIFLAKITRVEPSLQAAFVDYGASRHGFLPLTEIHPDYFKIPVADQEKLKKLSCVMQNNEIENDNEEINTSPHNDKNIQENDFDPNRNRQLENKNFHYEHLCSVVRDAAPYVWKGSGSGSRASSSAGCSTAFSSPMSSASTTSMAVVPPRPGAPGGRRCRQALRPVRFQYPLKGARPGPTTDHVREGRRR